MKIFQRIYRWFRTKATIREADDDIMAEIRAVERIQKLITVTDQVHQALERSIRKRLPPTEEGAQEGTKASGMGRQYGRLKYSQLIRNR